MSFIEIKGLEKSYFKHKALKGINLEINEGEIVGLFGPNGSGKTTLMNVLSGIYTPDEGEIYINSKLAHIHSPKDAFEYGIGMVHQHFKLVHNFTTTENIILGIEPKKGLSIDLKSAAARVDELSKRYGLNVDPYAKIEDISV